MKTNWQTKKLGEVCEFQGGTQPPKSTFIYEPREGYIRLLQIRDFKSDKNVTFIKDNSKLKKCNEDDIMIGRYGASVGQILSGKSGAYNVALMKALPDISILDKAYLKYFLETSEMQNWFSNCQRAAQAGFTQDEIGENKIPIPPLATQQKIVARLDEVLGNIAQAKHLRQDAIVDTEKILSQTLREIFEEGKEKGWEEKTLNSVCLKTGNIKWSENKESTFDYIDLSSVSREDFSILETQKVNESNAPSRAKKIVQTNDIIFGTTRPTLMRVTIIPEQYNNQLCSTGFCVLKADINRILPSFIFYFIQSSLFMDRMEKIQTGASYPAVSDLKVLETIIPLPPLTEQHHIVTRLDTLSAKLRELRQLQAEQLEDLKKLEKAYLREAFSGELV